MSNTPSNLADLPPDVQAFIAAQAAEMSDVKKQFLSLSLSQETTQKWVASEVASLNAALSAERTAHARAIQNRDTIIADLRLQLHGRKKTALDQNQKAAHSWRWS